MRKNRLVTRIVPSLLMFLAVSPAPCLAVEMAVLNKANWQRWVPSGKEVDCIDGDLVVRNDHILAVIAQPIAGRNANMTVRNVAGAVIDLTSRQSDNDQLSAYYPGAAAYALRSIPEQPAAIVDGRFHYRVRSAAAEGEPELEVHYELGEEPFLLIHTTYRNPHDTAIQVTPRDSTRADRSFEFDLQSEAGRLVAVDSWWHYAFAAVFDNATPVAAGDTFDRGRPVMTLQQGDLGQRTLPPGESFTITRRLLVGDHQLDVLSQLDSLSGQTLYPVRLTLRDPQGPVYNALVSVTIGNSRRTGRTDRLGQLRFAAPAGAHALTVEALGRPRFEQALEVQQPRQLVIQLQSPGYVRARITDPRGRRIACKVEFRSADESMSDPYFGPDTYVDTIHNLVYSAHGQFRQPIAPGRYNVLISHGPEYDAVRKTIDVRRGQDTLLSAQLQRTVKTPGWVSSDFHSHSTPSGDNTSAQEGRVLNLLAEHIEFGPCTEHNRISSYLPHLEKHQATHLMATCPGMELTGSPLPVNHQNAFPLQRDPRSQDGGAPTTDENPIVQIERLALWDGRSQKVVQGNHPNLMQVYGDRDLDGSADGGFRRMLGSMDVVEVHPPGDIFDFPTQPTPRRERSNTMFHWLQLLNQGFRIPGVVNTDAHYNFHGSGWLRNYLKSPVDDPERITIADMIDAAEAGNVIMTNGPYLEVAATAEAGGVPRHATAGDDLPTESGRVQLVVRVQCANWLNVNRVQLYFNGRPSAEHNFRRATHSDKFDSGVVKFDETFDLQFDTDTHIVVATIGEELTLGPVVGPAHQDDAPVAVANPVFVDVDADGFQPNGDTLGVPLPQ